MKYEYEVLTNISGKFDPEVVGVTLGSILGTCKGVEDWSIPFGKDFVLIRIKSKEPIEEEYLREQLNAEFSEDGQYVVKNITRKTYKPKLSQNSTA